MKNSSVYMFLGALCYFTTSLLVKGFVLMKLWAWLVVGAFNAPVIGFFDAMGAMLIVLFLFAARGDKKTDDHDYFKFLMGKLWFLFWFSGLVLLIGWVFSLIN